MVAGKRMEYQSGQQGQAVMTNRTGDMSKVILTMGAREDDGHSQTGKVEANGAPSQSVCLIYQRRQSR